MVQAVASLSRAREEVLPLRIAVVGAGPFVGIQHCSAVRALATQRIELACVCQRRPDDTLASKRFGVPLYTNVEEMTEQEHLDGIVIAAPTHEHFLLVERCIKGARARMARTAHDRLALRALLVEKPICEDLSTAMRLVELAEGAGVKILVGHHRRHSALTKRARELVTSPEFGQLRGMTGEFAILKPDSYFSAPYRKMKGKGGPLLINLVHDVDLLRYITGQEVSQVFTVTSSAARNHDCEDTGALTLVLDHGAVASFFFSDATPSPWNYEFTTGENPKYPPNPGSDPKDCYHFFGASQSLGFPSLRRFGYSGITDHSPSESNTSRSDQSASSGVNSAVEPGWDAPLKSEQHEVERADPLDAQMAHFARVCRGEEEPVCSGRDAMETLAVIGAVMQSSETQLPVRPMDLFRTFKREQVVQDLPKPKSRRLIPSASTADGTALSEQNSS